MTDTTTDNSPHLVFSYGTLKRGEPNQCQMDDTYGSAVFVGCGQTSEKYPLVVGTKYNIPFLMKLENQGHNVRGEVYEVDDKMLAHLDDFESHPTLYLRQEVMIDLTEDKDGKPIQPPQTKSCDVYFMTKINESMLKHEWLQEYTSSCGERPSYVKRCDRDPGYSVIDMVYPNNCS